MILPPQSRLLVFEEMDYKGDTISRNPKLLCFDIYKDYEYYILSLDAYPTAYIAVHKDDKMYGLGLRELDETPVYCHGGFTYANKILTGPNYRWVNEYEDKWVIGWDYGHYNDWANYLPEDIQLQFCCKKWTTREIIKECHEVIDSIIEYNKNGGLKWGSF